MQDLGNEKIPFDGKERPETMRDRKPAREPTAATTAETLLTAPAADPEVLVKLLAAAVGEKTPKPIALAGRRNRALQSSGTSTRSVLRLTISGSTEDASERTQVA
jgi:hypothetical protein